MGQDFRKDPKTDDGPYERYRKSLIDSRSYPVQTPDASNPILTKFLELFGKDARPVRDYLQDYTGLGEQSNNVGGPTNDEIAWRHRPKSVDYGRDINLPKETAAQKLIKLIAQAKR